MLVGGKMPAQGQNSAALLRVIRRAVYPDRIRKYKILVDGKQVGTIGAATVAEFHVPAGRLSVTARIDWGRSRPLVVDVGPGQTAEIEVSNTWGAFLALWAITFGAGSYLTLKQISAEQTPTLA